MTHRTSIKLNALRELCRVFLITVVWTGQACDQSRKKSSLQLYRSFCPDSLSGCRCRRNARTSAPSAVPIVRPVAGWIDGSSGLWIGPGWPLHHWPRSVDADWYSRPDAGAEACSSAEVGRLGSREISSPADRSAGATGGLRRQVSALSARYLDGSVTATPQLKLKFSQSGR